MTDRHVLNKGFNTEYLVLFFLVVSEWGVGRVYLSNWGDETKTYSILPTRIFNQP